MPGRCTKLVLHCVGNSTLLTSDNLLQRMRKLPQLVDGQRPAIHKQFFRSGIRDEVLQELVQLFLLFE